MATLLSKAVVFAACAQYCTGISAAAPPPPGATGPQPQPAQPSGQCFYFCEIGFADGRRPRHEIAAEAEKPVDTKKGPFSAAGEGEPELLSLFREVYARTDARLSVGECLREVQAAAVLVTEREGDVESVRATLARRDEAARSA